jgi:hypothetical protein
MQRRNKMFDKNQSRPTAGTMERQTQTIDLSQHTISGAGCQGRPVLDFIPVGPENAITGRQLSRLMGVSGREIRRRIALERAAGAIILSDGAGGYFQPTDNGQRGRDEVKAWLDRLEARGVSTLMAGNSARAWLRNVLPGQVKIKDNGERTI